MLVSLHQGLFFILVKSGIPVRFFGEFAYSKPSPSLPPVGSAAFSISAGRGVIRTAATWVIVWVFHIALIVGSNVFHHLAVAVVTGNFPPFFYFSLFNSNRYYGK